jgi:hypothetical protein
VSDEAELKAATKIRAKEATDFSSEEELTEVIDILQWAVAILEKEMVGSIDCTTGILWCFACCTCRPFCGH